MENENVVENVAMTVEEAVRFLNENGYGVLSNELAEKYLGECMSAVANYAMNRGIMMTVIGVGSAVAAELVIALVPWKKLFGKNKKNKPAKGEEKPKAGEVIIDAAENK